MKIALLAWESLHSIAVGGVAAHTSELAAVMASKGHQVHLFTRRMPNQSAHELADGVHYHRCFYTPSNNFVDDVNNMCRAFVDKFFEIEDFVGRFDIVHAHDWLCSNAMIWIKQGRGHKTVQTIHSTEYARCGNAFYNGQSCRVREQERAGTYWADKVIAVSEATKKEIMWMYEVPDSKAVSVDNGVNWERFDIDVDPGKVKAQYSIGPLDPTVLFCGRLAWQKGPDILIEAIPGILSKQPNAKFIIVGDGDMKAGLQNRVNQLRIGHAVRFLGYRNGDELIRMFKSCDVVCVPSRNEPFGIVLLEAWAAHKPVVVTENGGPGEFIRHEENGLKIYPRPDSVVWGINRIFSNFDNARQMGENGRKFLEERFDWNRIADKTIEIYHEICPQAAPAPEPIPVPEPVITDRAEIEVEQIQPAYRNDSLVRVQARVMIPMVDSGGAEAANVEVLNAEQVNRKVPTRHKKHYLKIKGNLEEVTNAIYKCREKLHEDVEGFCVPTGF
jgi:glycogen synthase